MTPDPESPNLPWQPIYTVERSGQPEVTVYGIVYGWAEERRLMANAGRALIRLGQVHQPLWSRSLLKPWQLMTLYPILKETYPALSPRHFALMGASHQADPEQLALLHDLLALGGWTPGQLQCPACLPINACNAHGQDETRSPLYNPCSGKHLGQMLYLKAIGQDPAQYLNPMAQPYRHLQTLLAYMLGKEPADFALTVDGCGMPNLAMSAVEMAQMYQALTIPMPKDIIRQAPDEVTDILLHWETVAAILRQHPEIVGGIGRLDTRLMQAFPGSIAKEGADGLLAVGIGPGSPFTDGAGFLIKLSGGYHPDQLESVIRALLRRHGLPFPPEPAPTGDWLITRFHFDASPVSP